MAAKAASSRSALLRAVADFVALRGFDDLYDLEKLSAQNGALASVTFQRKMPRHAAFAGNDVWGLDESQGKKKEVPWMCLECFAVLGGVLFYVVVAPS